jgi:hypothetical protein
MFCTLEDAWGNCNNENPVINKLDTYKDEIKETFNNMNSNINNNNINKKEMYEQYMHLKEMFDDNKVCVAVENHISKCPNCRAKYLVNRFDIPKIYNMVSSNKDVITIFLFVILIILILKLFK